MTTCGRHTCVTCALNTRWLVHTSCGIVLTIPTGWVDCYWWVVQWPMHSGFKEFGVVLLTMCLFVGGKQKKVTKITISTRKKSEHTCRLRHVCTILIHTLFSVSMNATCHHRHVCTVQKYTLFSVYCRTPSPIWLKCRCFQLVLHCWFQSYFEL